MPYQIESSYAFLYVQRGGIHYNIDIFIPTYILLRLQLRSGSTVQLQGLDIDNPTEIHMRPRKGSENVHGVQIPFIASVRFPNQPNVLRTFLDTTHKQGVTFTSIRTYGFRGESLADVMCEGILSSAQSSGFSLAQSIEKEIQRAAISARGEVIRSSPIEYTRPISGRVLSSTYKVDLPLLRGSYGKIRVDTYGKPKGRPLRAYEGKAHLARLQFDPHDMTIMIDLAIANLHTYLFTFTASNLADFASHLYDFGDTFFGKRNRRNQR